MRFSAALAAVLLLVSTASAQVDVLGGGTDCDGTKTASQLTSSFDTGAICTITDGASSSDCSAGGGSTKVTCRHNGSGTWVSIGSGGGGGSSIVLDIGDDGGNDSTGVAEIATNADANSILTEPSADKVLIDMSKDWPKADTSDDLTCTNCIGGTEIDESALGAVPTATALAANGANCSAASFPLGVDASGAVESCSTSISGNAGTATALAANGGNCTSGNYPLGVDASGAVETCTADDDSPDSDAEVPNGITVNLGASGVVSGGTVSTCARFDGSGNLVSATGDCPTGASTITYDATNDGANESSAITHIECSGSGLACTEPSADQAQIALDSTVSLLGQTIESSEITNSTVAAADMANGDHGAFTYSGNVASLDNDVVGTANIADADHGVFTYASGVASLDTDAVDVQTHLKDSECTNGQIIKKSGGAWDCGSDENAAAGLNIDRTLWVTTGGADLAEGGGDCSTEECCTLAAPCATIQQAINEATEMSPPTDPNNPVLIRVAAGIYDEGDIRLHNTDSASTQYLIPAHGVAIHGDGQITTTIYPSSVPSGTCIIDGRGAYSVKIKFLSISLLGSSGSSAICSDGGARGWEIYDVDMAQITNSGRAIDFKGPGNLSTEFYRIRPFDLTGVDEGRQNSFMVGSATSEGFCASANSGLAYGACASNSDCGGLCGADASNVGTFCAHNNDCSGDVCDTGECWTSATDYIFRNSLIQSNRYGVVFETMRTCNGGISSSLTGTVEVAFGATCSASVCSGITGSLACDTNNDCARYVVGSGTDFDGVDDTVGTTDDAVPVGERIIVNPTGTPETKTVRKVHSATLLEVSDEFTSNDAASLAFRRTDDGWPCDTNSDCASGASTGTCTTGSAGTIQKRFDYTTFSTANEGGECRDASGNADVPPVVCDADLDCSGGDTCISASLLVDGAYDVVLEHSIFGDVTPATSPDYHIIATNSANVDLKTVSVARSKILEASSGTAQPTDDAIFDQAYLGDNTDTDALITFNDDDDEDWFGYDASLDLVAFGGGPILGLVGTGTGAAGFTSVVAYDETEATKWSVIGGAGMNLRVGLADASVIVSDDDGTQMMNCDELDASSVANHCNFPVGLSESSGGAAYKVKAIQNECAVIEKLSNADDDVPLWMPNAAVTVRSVSCRCDERSGSTTGCDTTLATVTLEDNSGNAMTITGTNPTCTTGTATYAAVTAANTLTAGEGLRLNVTNTPTDDGLGTYTFCWTYTYD